MADGNAHTSAASVAREIRSRVGSVGEIKLHYLLYCVQGYHLAWKNKPAFSDHLEASEDGPMVASLPRAEEGDEPADSSPVPESVSNVVTYVLRRHGHTSGSPFMRSTHTEEPWIQAASGRTMLGQRISRDSMARSFRAETSELRRLRKASEPFRNNGPFVPDPPGLREALSAQHISG